MRKDADTKRKAEAKIRIVVLASGRGSNLRALLDACMAGDVPGEVVLVISNKEGAGALDIAEDYGVPTLTLPSKGTSSEAYHDEMAEAIKTYTPDLICLAGYMRILPKGFIAQFRHRILNIHPSLLPAFPGLHAQRQALAYGVKVSGCTVHFVDEGMDTGPIVIQRAVPVLAGDTEATLAARILAEEHQIYPLAVAMYAEGRLHVNGRIVTVDGEEDSQ